MDGKQSPSNRRWHGWKFLMDFRLIHCQWSNFQFHPPGISFHNKTCHDSFGGRGWFGHDREKILVDYQHRQCFEKHSINVRGKGEVLKAYIGEGGILGWCGRFGGTVGVMVGALRWWFGLCVYACCELVEIWYVVRFCQERVAQRWPWLEHMFVRVWWAVDPSMKIAHCCLMAVGEGILEMTSTPNKVGKNDCLWQKVTA